MRRRPTRIASSTRTIWQVRSKTGCGPTIRRSRPVIGRASAKLRALWTPTYGRTHAWSTSLGCMGVMTRKCWPVCKMRRNRLRRHSMPCLAPAPTCVTGSRLKFPPSWRRRHHRNGAPSRPSTLTPLNSGASRSRRRGLRPELGPGASSGCGALLAGGEVAALQSLDERLSFLDISPQCGRVQPPRRRPALFHVGDILALDLGQLGGQLVELVPQRANQLHGLGRLGCTHREIIALRRIDGGKVTQISPTQTFDLWLSAREFRLSTGFGDFAGSNRAV